MKNEMLALDKTMSTFDKRDWKNSVAFGKKEILKPVPKKRSGRTMKIPLASPYLL